MRTKVRQTDLFDQIETGPGAKRSNKFGGDKRTTRASRFARPVSVRQSMHLVLKSDRARGFWSFAKNRNRNIVNMALKKYSKMYGLKIYSAGNAGNHLHFHLKAKSHAGFRSFLRAFTGAVALKITGASKINKLKNKFWTQTPFTRFVFGLADFSKLREYLAINDIEGYGYPRRSAEVFVTEVTRARQRFRKLAVESS